MPGLSVREASVVTATAVTFGTSLVMLDAARRGDDENWWERTVRRAASWPTGVAKGASALARSATLA